MTKGAVNKAGVKALCVAWDGVDAVVSGGSDGQLRLATLAI